MESPFACSTGVIALRSRLLAVLRIEAGVEMSEMSTIRVSMAERMIKSNHYDSQDVMNDPVTTYYLEMLSRDELRPKACADPGLRIEECKIKLFSFNRWLYEQVGDAWQWFDKRSWTDNAWRDYAEAENLRTWVGYLDGTPAGYYELERQEDDNVQIAYFGLLQPFIGKGLGGYLLSHAITSAWDWGASRVWVHTCMLDHPHALKNYRARGMRVFKEEV